MTISTAGAVPPSPLSTDPRQAEATPLLTSDNQSSQERSHEFNRSLYRPEYSLSSLIEAHRQATHKAGMVWVAELAIWIWIITVWITALTHQAGVFTFHPLAQSLALFLFYQGIITLQPTDTPAAKRTGLLVHSTFQHVGSLSLLVGSSAILYNKYLHSAPHFTSWHGLLGFISVCTIFAQAFVGALVGFEWSRDYIVGDELGRKLWKFHRASGYLAIMMMTLTVLTATKADWVVMVTSKWSIWVLTISPIVALIGLLSLANMNKIFGR